jgi:hypothetical protein
MTLRDSWRNRPRVVCHRILFSLRRMNLQKGYRRWVGRRFLLGLLLFGALGFLVLCLLLRDQRVRLVQGYIARKTPPPPQDPTVGRCLGTYRGPGGGCCLFGARHPGRDLRKVLVCRV